MTGLFRRDGGTLSVSAVAGGAGGKRDSKLPGRRVGRCWRGVGSAPSRRGRGRSSRRGRRWRGRKQAGGTRRRPGRDRSSACAGTGGENHDSRVLIRTSHTVVKCAQLLDRGQAGIFKIDHRDVQIDHGRWAHGCTLAVQRCVSQYGESATADLVLSTTIQSITHARRLQRQAQVKCHDGRIEHRGIKWNEMQ